MTTSVQRRRGTTLQHSSFTGLEGELTIDTSKDTAVIHDGTTVGGFPLAKEGLENTKTTNLTPMVGTDTAADDTFLIYDTSAGAMKKITRAELNNAIEVDALANVTITGGSINGTTVGASTPSTGAFTTLTSSSTTTLNGTTIPASKTLLVSTDIGSIVQAYDADLTTLGAGGTGARDFLGLGTANNVQFTNFTYTGTLTGGTGVINIGSGQIYKDASGNLGVGTASPAYALDVRGDGIKGRFGNATIGCTVGNYVGGTIWGFANNGGNGGMFGDASNYIYFASAGAERMRIDSSGNVGIGTSSPSTQLHLQSNSATYIQITDVGDGASRIGQNGTALTFGVDSANGATERMRITSAGDVGIGTSSPAANLDIVVASGSAKIKVGNGTVSGGAYVNLQGNSVGKTWFVASNYNVGNALEFIQSTATGGSTPSGTAAMILDGSGNLGIGVTPTNVSTYTNLEVRGSAGGLIYASNSSGTVKGYFGNTASTVFLNSITSHPLLFGTADTERMRIDSSGNVGIGAASPANWANPKLFIKQSAAAAYTGVTAVSSTNGNGIFIGHTGSVGTLGTSYGGTGADTPLSFETAGSERMRIDASGNLLVGTTSALGGRIDAICNSSLWGIGLKNTSATANAIVFLNSSGSAVGSIYIDGSSTTYSTSSDYRLKENIVPMTGALAVVSQLKPVTYNWKAGGSSGQGFIAHELQAVVPDCVTGEKDAVDAEGKPKYQGIDTSFLVATLTAAIQEQQAIIENLTTRLNALEGK